MSRRPRKTERKNVDVSVIEEARRLIADGTSQRQVAERLGMPESTLRKRLKYNTAPQSLGRYRCTFTAEVELELLEYIKKLDAMFYGLTAKKLRVLAYDFAECNNIEHHFNKEKKIAGREWLRCFMKRHPSLALRQPTSTSIARAMGFNKPQVERFYTNLSELYDKHKYPPHRIFNMDESGLSTVPNKPPKVISTKGKRCVNKISSAERGQNVTVVCAMSASGQFIPPAFIFKRKRMRQELLDNAPPSSIGMVSDSSFITSDLFLNWLHHFKEHAMPTSNQPVLLILDNHTSHCTLAAVNYCRKHHIDLLSIPPHSSHRIQALDRCFFSPLKKYYSAEYENWLRNHPGRTVTTFQIATIFTPAYAKTATIANAIEGFRVSGIWPFNNEIFSEADFMASSVSERPPEADAVTPTITTVSRSIEVEALLSIADATSTTPPESQHKEARGSLSIDEQSQNLISSFQDPTPGTSNCIEDRELLSIEEDILEIAKNIEQSQKLPSTCQDPTPSTSNFVTISQLSPYPKSSVQRPYSKRGKRSEILISSPLKKQLEEAAVKKTGPAPKKAKKDGDPKTKKWFCPGCSEEYKEPLVEDWIQCSLCKNWWHENCSSYSGLGNFHFDFCK